LAAQTACVWRFGIVRGMFYFEVKES